MFGVFYDGLRVIIGGTWHKICIFNKKVVPLYRTMRKYAFVHTRRETQKSNSNERIRNQNQSNSMLPRGVASRFARIGRDC